MMDHIVIDTNALIMAISDKGRYNEIWKAFLDSKYTLCISNEILEEYVEVISRNISTRLGEAIAYVILSLDNVLKVDPHFHFNLIKADPDDNKFVDCAIAGSARLIVTEDHHFDCLKNISFPRIDIVSADQFLEIVKQY